MTWNDWAVWFADAFALGEWHARSVKVWIADVFIPGGTTPEEVKEASLAVLRSGAPGKPYEIMTAVLDEIKRTRASQVYDADASQRRGESESSGCPYCGGTGWAVVPQHPQPPETPLRVKLKDGESKWRPLATCAVACSCGAGKALNPRDHREEGAMTLDQYERRNPGWKHQMERERKYIRANQSADISTGPLYEALRRAWDRAGLE